jgi:proline racemase
MCGHGVIALVTALLQTGALADKGQHTPVNLDTPAGLVRATAHLDNDGQVERVSFLNVPSFLYARDVEIEVPAYGRLTVDIAFGGAFYAFLPAEQVGLEVSPGLAGRLAAAGEAIKHAANAAISIKHPLEADLSFLYGTIFTDQPEDPAHHSRNVCIFANGEVDRSPTGTGVSGRLALHYAKNEITEGQQIVIESIIGSASTFSGRVVGHAQVGPYKAVVSEVSGRAFITGRHEYIIDPSDELGRGFFLS